MSCEFFVDIDDKSGILWKHSNIRENAMSENFRFALREDLKDDKRFLPTRATPKSVGFDCRCAQEDRKPIVLRAGEYVRIPLGFRVIIPDNWWLQLNPRSSTFAKKSLHCLYGVIDTDWRGFMLMIAQYVPNVNSLGNDLILEFGEAIGQLIPFEVKDVGVEEISNVEFDSYVEAEIDNVRKDKGFGSTSK